MTTTNKNYLIIGLSAVIILIAFLWIKSCTKPKPLVIATTGDSTQYYKNKYGQTIAALKKQEESFLFFDLHYKDSIAKLFNARSREIQSYTQLISRLKARTPGTNQQIVYETEYRDTGSNCPPEIRSISDIFLDPYYMIQATMLPNYPDSNYAELIAYDTLSIVVREVKEGGWFNRKRFLEVDVLNANPHVSIEGIKYNKIPDVKPKKFGLGLQVGYGFSNSFKPSPYFGAGIHYSIIRF